MIRYQFYSHTDKHAHTHTHSHVMHIHTYTERERKRKRTQMSFKNSGSFGLLDHRPHLHVVQERYPLYQRSGCSVFSICAVIHEVQDLLKPCCACRGLDGRGGFFNNHYLYVMIKFCLNSKVARHL